MNWKIFALFALTAGMHITVHASENVNTPENRQFLKQQENLSRQLRENVTVYFYNTDKKRINDGKRTETMWPAAPLASGCISPCTP